MMTVDWGTGQLTSDNIFELGPLGVDPSNGVASPLAVISATNGSIAGHPTMSQIAKLKDG